jgi:hypothetical protein
MSDARLPIPPVLVKNLENVINTDLRHVFENGNVYTPRLDQLALDAEKWEVELDKTTIGFAASQKMHQLIHLLKFDDIDIKLMDTILRVFEVMEKLDIELDLVEFQNAYFSKGKALFDGSNELNIDKHFRKLEWIHQFLEIGKCIQVKLPERIEDLA